MESLLNLSARRTEDRRPWWNNLLRKPHLRSGFQDRPSVVHVGKRVAVFLVLIVGCQQEPELPSLPQGHQELLAISSIIEQFSMRARGQHPQNEGELQQFITTYGSHLLEPFGIRNASKLFNSPRDNAPFVIFYGKDFGKLRTQDGIVVAHEAHGIQGSRLLVIQGGTIQELSQDKFAALKGR
jgi:hypothetical protein